MASRVGGKTTLELITAEGSFTLVQLQSFDVRQGNGSEPQRQVGSFEPYEIVNQSLDVSGSFTVNASDVQESAISALVGDGATQSPNEIINRFFGNNVYRFAIVEYTSASDSQGNISLKECTRIEECQVSDTSTSVGAGRTTTLSFSFVGKRMPIRQ